MNYTYITILLLLASCQEENPTIAPPPPFEEIEIFDQQWSSVMDSAKEIVNLNNGVFYKDWYIYSGDLNFAPTLMAFNKETGNKDWEYVHSGIADSEIDYSILVGNIYIARTNKVIFAIDLDTRLPIWEFDFRAELNFSPGPVWLEQGLIYLRGSQNLNTDQMTSDILKFDPNTGFLDIFYSADSGSIGLSPHVSYTSKNTGREMFILKVYPNAGQSPPTTTQNIRAVDAETKQVIWETKDFTQFYASDVGRPAIIYNEDIVITGGDWSMYGFDIQTGEQLWKTSMPGYTQWGIWTKTNHLLKDDRLYVNEGGHQLHCLNPLDGSFIWQNLEDAPNCSDNMLYYEKEDYLVYTSWGLGSVMIVDALTGELVHQERSEDSTYNNDPVYDPETDMFFTSTYKNAVGFKINRPE